MCIQKLRDKDHSLRGCSRERDLLRRAVKWGICFFAVILFTGCHAKRTAQKDRPLETLNTIVSEVVLHRHTDTYRLPMPADAEGKNLFANAIARVNAWEKVHPGQFTDIISYTRGICYEKLGNLKESADEYSRVQSGDPELIENARKRLVVLNELQEAFRPPLIASDPEEAASLVGAARDRIASAIRKNKGTEWDSLVMLCAENRAVEEFLDLQTRRSQVGEATYRQAIESLIERFSDSKRIMEHQLRLGIYYEETGREWIGRAEYGHDLNAWKYAQQTIDKAIEIYVRIAQADGYPEKREAQARLDAVEELARKIDKNV